MKISDLSRPDKILLGGFSALTGTFYSTKRAEAKGNAQLTFIGEKRVEDVEVQFFSFNKDILSEDLSYTTFDKLNNGNTDQVGWLNFHGVHDVELIENLQKSIDLDRLTVRQILDTTQIPKVDEYENYLFFSIKSVQTSESGFLELEQISFVLRDGLVISFQEEKGDHFDYIRNKIRENLGWIRKRPADYLLTQLLDAILDNYFESIDRINHSIRSLESDILKDPESATLIKIETLKKEAEVIKRSLNPFLDALGSILNGKTKFIEDTNEKFYVDLQNSCRNALNEVESVYRSLEGLTNIYFSSLSQKMNEVMKVLTLVATIFIPLTFIAGIYGMNFENMPELGYRYGYFVVWGVMIFVFLGMMLYFKKRRWF